MAHISKVFWMKFLFPSHFSPILMFVIDVTLDKDCWPSVTMSWSHVTRDT